MKTTDYLQALVGELIKYSTETEWLEYKCNYKEPERIAKYISGLSNAATLCGKASAYLIWGINNDTHDIVGTNFNYRRVKKGAEELEAWLNRIINPKINFRFYEVEMKKGITVVILEIPCARTEPTKFAAQSYIRIGSNLKSLTEYKEKEAELWRKFDTTPYELRIAKENVTEDEVVTLLDFAGYYEKLEIPFPRNREKILEDLSNEKFICKNDAGNWDVTNFGALMIAKNLKKFDGLMRRGVRVIWYKNESRIEAFREKEFVRGYVFSHEEVIQYIMTIIPQEEIIVDATRKMIVGFPEIAIRELMANTMIHQSLEQRGTNPMVEVFSNRIEFANAGAPLVAIERIIDTVPVSRNENIAGFMHKCGICEERGSGYDKILEATKVNKMLAPRIENQSDQFTKAILFAKVPFEVTSKEDRIRTCYMQACLAYVNFKPITNTELRSLFGLESSDSYKVSRIIKDTVERNLIKPLGENTAPRHMKYIPYWA